MTKNLLLTSCMLLFTSLSLCDENQYDNLINKLSMEYDLDPSLIKAIIKVESNFNKLAVSPKGAVGLMQLMPETAKKLSVKNIHLPEENIKGGVRYLSEMLYLFQGDLIKALAAYNSGPLRVKQYSGVPPYKETQKYIEKVLTYRKKYSRKSRVYCYTDKNGCVVFFNR